MHELIAFAVGFCVGFLLLRGFGRIFVAVSAGFFLVGHGQNYIYVTWHGDGTIGTYYRWVCEGQWTGPNLVSGEPYAWYGGDWTGVSLIFQWPRTESPPYYQYETSCFEVSNGSRIDLYADGTYRVQVSATYTVDLSLTNSTSFVKHFWITNDAGFGTNLVLLPGDSWSGSVSSQSKFGLRAGSESYDIEGRLVSSQLVDVPFDQLNWSTNGTNQVFFGIGTHVPGVLTNVVVSGDVVSPQTNLISLHNPATNVDQRIQLGHSVQLGRINEGFGRLIALVQSNEWRMATAGGGTNYTAILSVANTNTGFSDWLLSVDSHYSDLSSVSTNVSTNWSFSVFYPGGSASVNYFPGNVFSSVHAAFSRRLFLWLAAMFFAGLYVDESVRVLRGAVVAPQGSSAAHVPGASSGFALVCAFGVAIIVGTLGYALGSMIYSFVVYWWLGGVFSSIPSFFQVAFSWVELWFPVSDLVRMWVGYLVAVGLMNVAGVGSALAIRYLIGGFVLVFGLECWGGAIDICVGSTNLNSSVVIEFPGWSTNRFSVGSYHFGVPVVSCRCMGQEFILGDSSSVLIDADSGLVSFCSESSDVISDFSVGVGSGALVGLLFVLPSLARRVFSIAVSSS